MGDELVYLSGAATVVAVAAVAVASHLRSDNLRLQAMVEEPEAPKDTFAPSEFTPLEDQEKLSAPSFEKVESGMENRGTTVNVIYTDSEGRPVDRAVATHALIRGYDETEDRIYHSWAQLMEEAPR